MADADAGEVPNEEHVEKEAAPEETAVKNEENVTDPTESNEEKENIDESGKAMDEEPQIVEKPEEQDETEVTDGPSGEQVTENKETEQTQGGDEAAAAGDVEAAAADDVEPETQQPEKEENEATPTGDNETTDDAEPKEQPNDAEPKEEGEETQADVSEGEGQATTDELQVNDVTPVLSTSHTITEAIKEEDEPTEDAKVDTARSKSPLVPQVLSRSASPRPAQPDDLGSPPRARSPDEDDEEEEDDEEDLDDEEDDEEEEDYEEEKPVFDREQLIERYHQAMAERETLQQQNYALQHKLADYFRRKKADGDGRQEVDKNVTDQEQRYLKYMAQLDELRRSDAEQREGYKLQMDEYNVRCNEKQLIVNDERQRFLEFKKQVASNAVNSRSGKAIAQKDIETYLGSENKKETDVVNVRLENIKLKNKLRKKELQLKSKEELAEGLHLIDFEQLKIENQTYNEKIEERNEELLKLRRKITNTVQVLTHLKEKLQFVQAENQVQKQTLRQVEQHAAKKRDILSRTKQARDHLRIDNQKLRQNCGLLGNESLLRDFEERKDEGEDLREKLDNLRMTHAELTLNTTGIRRKIEQTKQGRA